MKHLYLFSIAFFISCSTIAQLNGLYTVDPSGNGDFETMEAAAAALNGNGMSGNVTLQIQPGTYSEQAFFDIPDQNPNHILIIQGATSDPQDVVFDFVDATEEENYQLGFQNIQTLEIRNISVNTIDYDNGLGIDLRGVSGEVLIENLYHEGNRNDPAIQAATAPNFLDPVGIESLEVRNSYFTLASNSIEVAPSLFTEPEEPLGNIYVHNNTFFDADGLGVRLATNIRFEENTCYGGEFSVQPLDLSSCSGEIFVLRNNIWKSFQTLKLTSCTGTEDDPILVANNFLSGSYDLTEFNSNSYLRVVYNSIYGDDPTDPTISNFSNENSEFLNNIFYQNDPEGTLIFSFGLEDGSIYDYNCMYSNGAYYRTFDGGLIDLNYEEYQTETGNETNGISVPPVFEVPGEDLHVTNSLLNVATPLTYVVDDIDGELRSLTNPTIGADEIDGSVITLDLVVDTVTVQEEVVAGEQALVEWSGSNAGNTPFSAPWTDRIFISADNVLDEGDPEIGSYLRENGLEPTETYEHQSLVNIPLEYGGINFIIVEIDSEADLNEDNSNNIAVSAPLDIQEPALPDLVVTNIEMPDEAFSGTTFDIAFTVTNVGEEIAGGEWIDRVWMSTDPDDFDTEEFFELNDPYAEDDNLIGLAPGESYTTIASGTLPAAGQGLRYVKVAADAENSIIEGSGNEDNIASSVLDSVFVNQSPLADLVIEEMQTPPESFAGQEVNISYKVVNVGTAPTAPVELPFNYFYGYTWAPLLADWVDYTYLTDSTQVFDPAEYEDVFSRLGEVLPDSSYLVNETVQIPGCISGPYFVVGYADRWGHVVELDETNNAVFSDTIQVLPRPSPDMVPSSEDPLTGWASNTFQTLSYSIENLGSDTVNMEWMDRLYVSDSTTMQYDQDELIAEIERNLIILPGETANVELSVEVPPSVYGMKNLFLWIDAQNDICEYQQDSNNILTLPISIEQSPAADLVPSFEAAPLNIVAGDELSLDYSVSNFGDDQTNASQWKDVIFLKAENASSNDTSYAEYFFRESALASDGEYAVPGPFTIPLDIEPGDYRIGMFTDLDQAVWENELEENNLLESEVFSLSLDSSRVPDLEVESIEGPENLISGNTYAFTISVLNQENETGIANWVDALQLIDEAGDVYAEETALFSGSLSQFESYQVEVDLNIPVEASGELFLRAVSDTALSLLQYNRQNDTLLIDLQIAPGEAPDLVPTDFDHPDQVFAGQPIVSSVFLNNEGPGGIVNGSWVNRLVLSSDNTPDEDDLVLFSEAISNADFPAGASEFMADTSFIPLGYAGEYFLIFEMDANDQIFENDQDNNNTIVSSQPIEVDVPLPVDLITQLDEINLIENDISSIDYAIFNPGPNDFNGQFYNAYFLSEDDAFSNDDVHYYTEHVITQDFPFWNIDIPTGEAHNRSVFPSYKPMPPGDYYIIQKVDVNQDVYEVNETNNTFVFGPVFIDNVEEIFSDITYERQFSSSFDRDYYKIQIPEGNGMIARLWEDEEANEPDFSFNDNKPIYEIYIGENFVPSPQDFDFKFDAPLQNDQTVLVPTAPERTDFMEASAPYIPPVADEDSVPASNYLLRAEFREFSVYSATPNKLGTQHCTTLRIQGFDFNDEEGFDVGLISGSDTTFAFEVYPQNSSLINAYVDLRDQEPGSYELMVRKRSTGVATVWEESIAVVQDVGALPNVNVIAPGAARSSQDFQVQVAYENRGYSNEYDVLLFVVFTMGDTSSIGIEGRFLGGNTLQSSEPGPEVDDQNPPGELIGVFDYGVVYATYIPILHAQHQEVLTFELNCAEPGIMTTYSSFFMLQRSPYTFTGRIDDYETSDWIREVGNSLATVDGLLECATGAKAGNCNETLDSDQMTLEILQETKKVAEKARGSKDFVDTVKGGWRKLTGQPSTLEERYEGYKELAEAKGELSITADEDTPFASQLQGVFDCIGEDNIETVQDGGCYELKKFNVDGVDYTVRVNGCQPNDDEGFTNDFEPQNENDLDPEDNDDTEVENSEDPNEIVGPAGEGPLRLIEGDDVYQYTIYFENVEDAGAPAVRVRIDNPLDSAFRTATLRIQSFGFADTTYFVNNAPFVQNTYELAPEFGNQALRVIAGVNSITRKAFFEFNTINPETQGLVTGPGDGFLFPNDSTGRGQGFVTYTIQLEEDLEPGVEVPNDAAIIFDENEIIETNTWTNTISGGELASRVEDLAEFSPETFRISWRNETPPFGPMVEAFDIYYRIKGGDQNWKKWLNDTKSLSKMFTGMEGVTYQFKSSANSANSAESILGEPDAETTVFKFTGELGDNGLLLFPNPATESTRLTYNSPPAGRGIEIDIFDSHGRVIQTYGYTSDGSGTRFFNIPTNRWNAGVYYVRFKTDEIEESVRLVVVGRNED